MKIYRPLGLLLIVAALVLSACGGTPAAESPTAAPAAPTAAPAAPTAAPAAPTAAPPTPTFETVSEAEPTIAAPAATGALGWRDQILRNDAALISITGLSNPEAGQTYAAWLSGKDSSLALGTLSLASNGVATVNYVSPTNDNLLGTYERVYITKGTTADATAEVKNVVMSGALPEKALIHIRHILFSIDATPSKLGFVLGLRQEADELQRHAQFLKDALDAGDFALVKVHAEHIANIAEGSEARDLNGDGKIQNPGDGFGLLQNGEQDGYIKGMIDHAKLAAEAPDATEAIKLHASHVQIAGENVRIRVQDIHDRADRIAQAGGLSDVQQDVLAILALASQTIQGVDANQDEQIGPVPGEGGVLTAYQHAQLMAAIPLTPVAAEAAAPAPAAAAPAPAAQPQTLAVAVEDNKFTPNKITVPVGATIIWTNSGQKPHTVTADDGAFDSGTLNNGGTFSQTFAKAGTFPYFCQFHGGKGGEAMAGTIIVAEQSAAAAAPPATQPTPAVAAPPPAAGEAAVAIGDNTFTPQELEVPVGTTVVWTNGGKRAHTVSADDDGFKSDTLNAGATFKHTFDKPGNFPYYCEFHGSPGQAMFGVIKVVAGGGASAPPPAAAPPTAPPPPPTAAPPPPAAAAVSMKDFEFAPKEIKVKVGTTITWKNDGAQPHSATAVDKSFDTGIFQPGESKSSTFNTAGTFLYYCQLHGTPDGKNGMVGTVVVEP